MRILVYGLSANKLAGIETFLLNMNKFMSKDMIFDYIIKSADCKTIHENAINEKGGRIFYMPPKKKIVGNILSWIKLLRNCRREYDTIYFNYHILSWFVPVLVSRLFRYHVVVHAHNNSLHDCTRVQRALHYFNRGLQNNLDITRVTNSELSAKFFFGKSPATMIYCAIDPERFKFDPTARKKIRDELGISEGKHVYGFSGRVEYQKNPLFLMDIFKEVQKLDVKAEFLVCGDGNLMEETKKKADEYQLKIHFVGSVKNVEQYYQAMDVFVLPSRFEGLGIVLIEAQCAGLPCITSLDVVPRDAQISEKMLRFLSLSDSAKLWAEEAIKYTRMDRNRKEGSFLVREAGFDIVKEAVKLERILLDT